MRHISEFRKRPKEGIGVLGKLHLPKSGAFDFNVIFRILSEIGSMVAGFVLLAAGSRTQRYLVTLLSGSP